MSGEGEAPEMGRKYTRVLRSNLLGGVLESRRPESWMRWGNFTQISRGWRFQLIFILYSYVTWILDKRLKVLSNSLWTKKSGTHWSMETFSCQLVGVNQGLISSYKEENWAHCFYFSWYCILFIMEHVLFQWWVGERAQWGWILECTGEECRSLAESVC